MNSVSHGQPSDSMPPGTSDQEVMSPSGARPTSPRMTTTAAGPERGQPGVVRPALDGGEAHGAQPEAVRPDGALEAGGTGVAGSVDGAMVSGDSMDSGHGTSGQVARVQALALASGAVVAGGMQAVVASTSMTREVEPAGEAGDMGMLRDGLNSGGHQQPGGFSWNAQGSPMGREAQPRGAMPTWVSRLGAFFQAMGQSQQVTPPEWMPSPFPSPMTRPSRSQRALESPMSQGERDEASRTPLFDDEQRQQMRAMEQRAPLLYGATGVGPRPMDGGGSSGGSTYEAVKEEVRQQLQGQLQGMMRELEESKREASSLREEMGRMQLERERMGEGQWPHAARSRPGQGWGQHLWNGLVGALPGPSGQLGPRGNPGALHPVQQGAFPESQGNPGPLPPVQQGAFPESRGNPGPLPGRSLDGSPPVQQGASTESRGNPGPLPGGSLDALRPVQQGASTESRGNPGPLPGRFLNGQSDAAGGRFGFMPHGQSDAAGGQEQPLVYPRGPPQVLGGHLGQSGGAVQSKQPPAVASAEALPESGGERGQPSLGPGGDPMSRLLEGLERVITKSQRTEDVHKPVGDIPMLPALSDSASVDFGDWLHCLEHAMGDLSTSSAEWWQEVKDCAKAYYDSYQKADHFNRLNLAPLASPVLQEARWQRVDRRAATLLLASTPEDIRRELVASRVRSSLEILSRLMVLYRPGSAMEKSSLLRHLESPPATSTAAEAVDGLRLWWRYFQRAKDLGVVIPDPSVLLRGIDVLVKKPLLDHHEVAFRMNLIRYQLKVDFVPVEDNVKAVHKALLAEFEQLASRKPRGVPGNNSPSTTPNSPQARLKGLAGGAANNQPKGDSAGSQKPCKFFGVTDGGCRRGKACRSVHSWPDRDAKRERCWNCGGKGHQSKACPTRPAEGTTTTASASTPTTPTAAQVQAKPMQPETQKMIKADDVATVISEASTMASTPMATRSTLDDPIPGTPMDMQQMLENAQKMVKSLMEHSATMKVMRITSAESEEVRRAQALGTLPAVSKMGLLDSGATHALRPGTVEEKKKAAKVEVALAGDTKIELPQSDKGTILGDNQAQPIVPLGTLVRQLGYEFVWNARGCRLRHPSRPEVQVYTRSSCPEVRECDALRLIAELEGTKADEALRTMQELETSIKVARSHEGRNWADFLKDYVVTGDPSDGLRAVLSAEFMSDVPFEDKIRIFEKIPQSNEEAWKLMKSLPLNRARRRSLWASRRWIVHLFSGKGESSDPIKTLTGCRVQGPRGETREASMAEVLEIDLTQSKSWDIGTNGGIFALLLWAASQGKIHAIVGGPPCRTFSLLRHRELQGRNNAPRPVRSAQHLWGLPGQLTRDEEALVRGDNNLILRMVWLWLVAETGLDMCYPRRDRGPAVAFGMEHPDDPREFLQPGAVSNEVMEKCASFWRTKLVEHMKNNGMNMYRFDQGALGHPQRKPTGLLTTMELDELSGLKDTRREWPEPGNSKDMAVWAPGLREALAKGIRRWAWRGEISVAMNTFTPKQLEEWRRHVEAGHWPFRRDCSVCLSAAGTGRPARRVLHRDAYVLSLDIGGACAEKGIDERNDNGRANKYKFVLAATYVFPKAFDVVSKDMPIPDDIDEYLGQEEVDEEGPEPEAAEEEVERKEDKDHEEEWKRLVGDLNKPQEFQVLRFAVPLAKHKGADILAAVQDLYIYLRANGFPLARIHSDRAREFRTKQLRRWCRERDIYQTYTEGLAPTQNAMAENQVKWLKARARVLLTASGLNKKYWPCAMKHACAAHNTRQLGKTMTPIQFGSQVMVKTKKDVGPFDPRWEEAVYLGPADDVREGHVLELADGTWHRTLHMRVVRDDEVPSGGDESWVADRVDPGRRVRGKRRLEDPDGPGVRVLQEGQEDGEEEIAEQRAHDKLEYNKYEDEDALEIVRALRLTSGPKRRGTQDFDWCGSWSTGAYVHGGVWGVQTNTTKFPKVTRFLTTFLRNKMKEPMPFGTIVVNVNQELLPHRDLHNEREFANSVYGMGDFSGGEVWEQTYLEENTALDVYRATTRGLVRGRTMDVKGKIQALWAHRWHATMPWTGTRVTVVGYVPRKFKNVGSENYNLLRDMGFMVPVGADEEEEDDVQEPQQKVLQGNDIEKGGGWNESVHVPGGHVELGVHWTMKFVREGDGGEGELSATPTFPVQDHVRERVQERLLWARELLEEEREIWERQERQTGIVDEYVKTVIDNLEETVAYMELYLMQDNQAHVDEVRLKMLRVNKVSVEEAVTQNVEQLLQGLEGPLEVVHNVSLQEVREHLTDWVPSMKKEVATLETSGTLRPIPLSQAKRQSEAGELILVPGKTVFTVKPPEDVHQSKYKRKTRFEICGNFVKDGDTTELYTANAKAESVRCSLATAASRNWEAAGTDINRLHLDADDGECYAVCGDGSKDPGGSWCGAPGNSVQGGSSLVRLARGSSSVGNLSRQADSQRTPDGGGTRHEVHAA